MATAAAAMSGATSLGAAGEHKMAVIGMVHSCGYRIRKYLDAGSVHMRNENEELRTG